MEKPVISGGAILVARKLNSSAIFEKPPLYLKVWLFLLTQAQHNNYKDLKRGQLYTSIPKIQKAVSWKVGYRTETPTKDQIFNVLEWLRKPRESNHESNESTPMITTTKATHGMLITICNYNVYQTLENYESNSEPNDNNDTNTRREQRHADNINKNVYKNDIYSGFPEEKEPSIPFKKIIDYLNQQTAKKFRNVASNQKFIKARWNEGYRLEDFQKVVDIKLSQWKNTEYEKYLQPSTLFGTKFDQYLNEPMSFNNQTSQAPAEDVIPFLN